ncbi:MAG: helix-turn-helix domain-containing protein [Chloroflexi bacterium]|nr:helix-turn-helix domain-containing protein [Chloroflexota bacterium]
MKAELPTKEILDFANEKLREKSLQSVTRRTIDYWISIGLIDHPKRKGKAGGGLFPDWVKLHVVGIRELQERYNFTLADIRALVANGTPLENVLSLMTEVERTYGQSMMPYARAYACARRVDTDAREEAASFYVGMRIAEGDEEIEVDEVAALVGLEGETVLDLARSRELPCHGDFRLRFLKSEVTEWKERNASAAPTEFTDLMAHLIQLNNELGSIQKVDDLSEKSHEWLAYWIDAVDNELWRLRRLSHEAQMRKKVNL